VHLPSGTIRHLVGAGIHSTIIESAVRPLVGEALGSADALEPAVASERRRRQLGAHVPTIADDDIGFAARSGVERA
jgi:hypothetical protein